MQPFGVLQVNLKYETLVASVCQIIFQFLDRVHVLITI